MGNDRQHENRIHNAGENAGKPDLLDTSGQTVTLGDIGNRVQRAPALDGMITPIEIPEDSAESQVKLEKKLSLMDNFKKWLRERD